MPIKTTFGVFMFAALSLVLFNSGCSGKNSGDFGSFTMPSYKAPDTPPGSGPTPTPTDPSTPSFNDTNFHVSLPSGDTRIAYMHKASGFSESCAIPTDATSSQDIECIVEIPEGELYVRGLDLNFNVPGNNFCSYLSRTTYWYFNKEVGVAPSDITIQTTIDPGGTVSHLCSDLYEGPFNCASHPEITLTFDPATHAFADTSCYAYDGCCFGEFKISQTIEDQGTGVTTTQQPVRGVWSSDHKSCFGGAAITSWGAFSATGVPISLVTSSINGLNDTYGMSAPIELKHLNNRMLANYYTPALHTHTGFLRPEVSNRPFFIDPVDDYSGTLMSARGATANEAYTFSCYDAGYEMKHRIRVYVREWDTRSNYVSYITSNGTSGNPNSVGNCNGMPDGTMLDSCNDFTDPDSFVMTELPAGYDTTLGGSETLQTKRRLYFPYDLYQ
ncbi:hypothetical protein [Pseudobdellovibrio exovorus]|uniref:Lipoprotein n=1 Tax=Pseudobdellovibrio exovorus JSS TaxID=1184267 RepID=M4VF94_9BACT|nr:hypothetical protein [Pseudobdellovibrio exovorus]AGH96721.1 hypothetical protein A11Q_2505 [Pseudobdellovibrio exovorus JSS]